MIGVGSAIAKCTESQPHSLDRVDKLPWARAWCSASQAWGGHWVRWRVRLLVRLLVWNFAALYLMFDCGIGMTELSRWRTQTWSSNPLGRLINCTSKLSDEHTRYTHILRYGFCDGFYDNYRLRSAFVSLQVVRNRARTLEVQDETRQRSGSIRGLGWFIVISLFCMGIIRPINFYQSLI